ncbi:hypothetical protein D3C71_1874630 [compost metagenome]
MDGFYDEQPVQASGRAWRADGAGSDPGLSDRQCLGEAGEKTGLCPDLCAIPAQGPGSPVLGECDAGAGSGYGI